MGLGAIHCKSSRQKLNTRSTTESELVGISEYLPYDIWFLLFLEAQGGKIHLNLLFQDNESVTKMANNGRNSCTDNSRHIEIKYFWVKDIVDKRKIRIKYCPTWLMLADYFSKLLQGSLFKKYRDIIMGYIHIDEIKSTPDSHLRSMLKNGRMT